MSFNKWFNFNSEFSTDCVISNNSKSCCNKDKGLLKNNSTDKKNQCLWYNIIYLNNY